MALHNDIKIKKLLQAWPPQTVGTTTWLESLGISRQLLLHYVKSGWIEKIGQNAFKRYQESMDWKGGLYAVQRQLHRPVHVGGLTALVMQGLGHYARAAETVFLFSPLKVKLPRWFSQHTWNVQIMHIRTSMLPDNIGLVEHEEKTFSLTVATPERAIFECLHVAPDQMDLVECYHLMEGLVNLRPNLLQQLLENCTSIKVKRLFLYMATKAGHQWLKHLDTNKIDLGKGDRSIIPGGVYVASQKITISKELADLPARPQPDCHHDKQNSKNFT
jgi:hypothetical protein